MFPLGFVVSVVGAFTKDLDPMLYSAMLMAALMTAIGAIVELGLMRGTLGPNRYGPDPLAKIRSDPRQAGSKTSN